MLTAIVQKLGVDGEWLIQGTGEPFGLDTKAPDPVLWMPVRDRLLAERLPRQLRALSDRTITVPGYRPSTQYWFRLTRGEPVLNRKRGSRGFLNGDHLLMETDPAKFPAEEKLLYHVCAVRSGPGVEPPVKLGAVEFSEADAEEGPRRLEVDTFDDKQDFVHETVIRRHPGGKVEVEERVRQRRERRGRVEYLPVSRLAFVPNLREIKYADIVAVWTGILYRRDQFGSV
jgi:hypothetical protein